ncbi:MAG: DUF1476 family protein [Alphaproteobacteria bacterium]|nr:DUF1476 family protein [Alphaproteobacteria bacterium]OJV47538.1 MAG: hypothetical protein BGO28_06800 [Alphaproteobacteria bacterium 43-37]
MSVLKDREKALEELYHIDEEKKFKATVKAVESFGAYISQLLSLSPEAGQSLVERYVQSHFESGSIESILLLAEADLDAAAFDKSSLHLKKEYEEFFKEALSKLKEREEKAGVP